MLASMIAAWLLTLSVSCRPTAGDYSDFVALPAEGWAYGDTLELTPEALDSVRPKKITVALRHNDRFPYRNLWLEVSYRDGGEPGYRTDTVNIPMADTYGRWLGHGIGTSFQCSAEVAEGVNILPGSTVRIRHVMRVDTLRGIEQIGIAIQE